MGPLPPPVPKPAPAPSPSPSPDEAPKKRRRTLRDAESELESCRLALREAKRKLVLTVESSPIIPPSIFHARENAKMKVLLVKYFNKDDSLLCSSQLSGGESQPTAPDSKVPSSSTLSQSPREYTTAEEGESEESSLWSNDFQPDAADGDGLLEPISQLSQVSQASHWSELSSTSNLDAIISFLESQGQSQDASESTRLATLQSEYTKLKAQQTVVRVGVGVLLMSKKHPNCVLIGQRKGSHGAGKFALPGGHLEMFESWQECAIREVKEETDLDLTEVKLAFHYITILMQAVVDDEQPVRNMEPNKCVGWTWERWSDLRSRDDMFTPLLHVTRSNFRPKFLPADDEESDQD
ncbi:hypothetical protein BBJ28_00007118 [Nothophytophthora sp. Chile5]|nr:hypothetical protein BBJ28_00007118 [Nothophytophthora sp. Chile5]